MPQARYPINKLPVAPASIRDWHRVYKTFKRVDSTVQRDEEDSTFTGDVTWAANLNGRTVAVAWKWREVLPNVVALSDPMGIESNVVLLDEDGTEISEPKRLLYLNAIVNRLHWQTEFRRLSRNRSRANAM